MPASSLSWLVVLSGQMAALVLVAAALAATGRTWPAWTRYAYWRLVVMACLALPLLPAGTGSSAGLAILATGAPDASAAVLGDAPAIHAGPDPWLVRSAAIVLLGGLALRSVWLLVGLRRLGRLRAAAAPDRTGIFDDLVTTIAPAGAIHWHAGVSQPVTFGIRHPVVLLPPALRGLTTPAQRAVVAHELVHVARRDWRWLPIEEAVRTVFWFHPFLRWAISQVQLNREQLVDAAVVAITNARAPYMEALLRFAEPGPLPTPAMPFVRRRHVMDRIRALAREDTMSFRNAAVAGLLSCGVVAVAGWTIARVLPLPVLAAQSTGAAAVNAIGPLKRANVVVNATYPDEARGLGISADVSVGVTVAPSGEIVDAKAVAWGYHVQGDDTQARAAFLSAEPVNKRFVTAAEEAARQWRFDAGEDQWTTGIRFEFRTMGGTEQVDVSSPNAVPPPVPVPGEPLRVGGPVKAPRWLTRADPVYPPEARLRHVEGVVILEVLIGRDGHVNRTEVLRSIPILDQAAIDAVRQWTYEPTVIDGTPTEVFMTVSVNFTLS